MQRPGRLSLHLKRAMRILRAPAITAAILIWISLRGTASAASTADLSVSIIGRPNPVVLGHTVTWTITVKNLGPGVAQGVLLDAFYGSDASVISMTTTQGTCPDTGVGGIVRFSMGSILPGRTVIATVATQDFGGDGSALSVRVRSTSKDPNLKNNLAIGRVRVIPGPFLPGLTPGSFCAPSGGVRTGGGGTAAGSSAWLATLGLLAMAGIMAAALKFVGK